MKEDAPHERQANKQEALIFAEFQLNDSMWPHPTRTSVIQESFMWFKPTDLSLIHEQRSKNNLLAAAATREHTQYTLSLNWIKDESKQKLASESSAACPPLGFLT